jgi:hypothetical protein
MPSGVVGRSYNVIARRMERCEAIRIALAVTLEMLPSGVSAAGPLEDSGRRAVTTLPATTQGTSAFASRRGVVWTGFAMATVAGHRVNTATCPGAVPHSGCDTALEGATGTLLMAGLVATIARTAITIVGAVLHRDRHLGPNSVRLRRWVAPK